MKKKLLIGLATGLFFCAITGAASATPINVAPLSGIATQSSTLNWGWDASADLAIDGNTDGDYSNGSVTHTLQDTDPFAWWEVDLGQNFSINEIDIWNRTDWGDSRLSPYSLSILEDDRSIAWSFDFYGALPANNPIVYSFSGAPVSGQFVRIQLLEEGYLHLAEVQVFSEAGNNAEPVPEPATMLLFGTGLAGLAGSIGRKKKKD